MGAPLSANDDRAKIEGVGSNYDVAGMLEARARTRAVIHEIAAAIVPGMVEEDAMEMARGMLKAQGLLRGWHGLHIRFGANTLKNFGEPSEPNTTLSDSDIFFIDIGPVWKKWEGDGGETFVVGSDPKKLAIKRDVRAIFDAAHAKWRSERLNGIALYNSAAAHAESLGWKLNLDMSGHRLSDFPHSAFHKGPLAGLDFTPSAGLWVLEIQIRHPSEALGAFYEDMLLGEVGSQ